MDSIIGEEWRFTNGQYILKSRYSDDNIIPVKYQSVTIKIKLAKLTKLYNKKEITLYAKHYFSGSKAMAMTDNLSRKYTKVTIPMIHEVCTDFVEQYEALGG